MRSGSWLVTRHARRRRLLEQPLDDLGGFDELLEVVQHEERRARTEPPGHRLVERAAVAVDRERRRNRRNQRAGLPHARERHQPRPTLEGREQPLRGGDGQACLARASQAEDRDQALVSDQRATQRRELLLATDEPPGIRGQVRRSHQLGAQRREAAVRRRVVRQLPEPLGRGEVLEPMLAQLGELEPLPEQRPRRVGDQDLTAVTGGGHAHRELDLQPAISPRAAMHEACMDADAHAELANRRRPFMFL